MALSPLLRRLCAVAFLGLAGPALAWWQAPAADPAATERVAAEARAATADVRAALADGDAAAARTAAEVRLAGLRALVELDPRAAAALLLPADEAAAAAASLGARVETRLEDLELPLSVYHFDDFDGGRSWDEHVVVLDGQRLDLYGVEGLADLRDGGLVRIAAAVRIDDALLALTPVEAVAPVRGKANRYANARIALLMVNFNDDARTPWTRAQVEAALQTNTQWYDEGSYGKQTTTYQVFGWYTLPISKEGCPWSNVQTEARRAAQAAGVDLSAFNIVGYAFPNISCGWAGLGGGGNFWLNGDISLRVVSHEVGHVLGIGHAFAIRCPNGSYIDTTTCERREYGSPFDVMGASSAGHFHAGAKAALDYLEERSGTQGIQTITRSGEYVIGPYAAATAGLKALAIPRLGGPDLHVEFRRAIGFDARLGSRIGNRVQVTSGSNTLFDLTPATTTWDDASLNVGETFDEPGSGIRLRLLSADDSGARLRVDLDPCGRTAPVAQAIDLTPGSLPGEAKRLRIDVSNLDDPAQCASPTTFRVLADPVAGTPLPPATARPTAELAVAPGASGSVELEFAVPPDIASGLVFYLDVANVARPALKTRPYLSFPVARARLAVVAGDNQSAATGRAFATPLRVRLTDAAGQPVANSAIGFATPGGEASALLSNSARCTTDATGECAITATARSQAASYVVRATSAIAHGELPFRLTNTAATAPPADSTPDAAQFGTRGNVGFRVPVLSPGARVTGINVPVAISVANGEYSIGCTGAFTTATGSIIHGQSVCLRHTSASTSATTVTTTLSVGTASWTFASTTATGGAVAGATDTVPDAFTIPAQRGVALGGVVVSAPVTVRGINAPAAITVSGGEYAIGCGTRWTSGAGSIGEGETVCVRHTSAARHSVSTTTTLSIGGVPAGFESTTLASTRPQTADQFDFSGGWFEPATTGQGLMVEMYTRQALNGGAPYLFAGWFTYTGRAGGVAEQDWYTLEGNGNADGRSFTLQISRPNPGVFDAPPATGTPLRMGTATLVFSSCTEAVLDYRFDAAAGGASGQVVLQRLIADVACDEGTPVANAPRGFLNSGAWFEPATSGQGLVFEVNPRSRFLFGAWYTYAASGPGDYRWFSLQKGDVDTTAMRFDAVPIIESTGGRFDDPTPTTTRTVGEASIEFTGCSSGRMTYRFTVGELAGRSGEIPLTRVGPAPTECR